MAKPATFGSMCVNMTGVPVADHPKLLRAVLDLACRIEHLSRREPDKYAEGIYLFDFTRRSTASEREATLGHFAGLFSRLNVDATARGA